MQILADTCIWVGHLRAANSLLQTFLEDGVVLMHPSVRCELALGSLKNRAEILGAFAKLPQTEIATNDEVLYIIEARKLWGLGIGWVDAQLLAATSLTPTCHLWTIDQRLHKACEKSGVKLFSGAA